MDNSLPGVVVETQQMFPSPDGELVGLDIIVFDQQGKSQVIKFPSPDGELVGLDFVIGAVLYFPLFGRFPSPDGELVGLDSTLLLYPKKRRRSPTWFPSPDGELVGLDPIPLETLQYGVFKVRSRETT